MNKPELADIYFKAAIYGLDFSHMVDMDEMRRIYNGVGAEWMPKELREFLDGISEALLPAVLIHDIDYAYGDGTLLDFQKANKRLEANGRICADKEYGWWNPMRYIVRRQAKAYARICNAFGLVAYMEAIEETKKQTTNAPKEV